MSEDAPVAHKRDALDTTFNITLLLKGLDGRGFVFFSNYESRKGRQLHENPHAALVFPWVALERQVIVEGAVAKVTREETEAYFHSRPVASQLGAWASQQSAIIPGRAVLEENLSSRLGWRARSSSGCTWP